MESGQEWRTENSNRSFPFVEGSSVPQSFISDIKFFYDKKTIEKVYLSSVNFNGTLYTLTFSYVSDGTLAISGTVEKNHGKKVVSISNENRESFVIFSTGDAWDDNSWANNVWPQTFTPSQSTVDASLVSSGPRLIRRIVIEGEEEDQSRWRKETVQKIVGGTNVDLSFLEGESITPLDRPKDFIEISARLGAGDGSLGQVEEESIFTINGIKPSNGNFNIRGFDCIKHIDKPDNEDHTVKVMSDCLPCCGCSSYQLISDAITYRSKQLSELCKKLNALLASSAEKYNNAVLALSETKLPIARIRSIRVYKETIKLSLQNICSLPILGVYGVTISTDKASFSNASPPSVPVMPLSGAPQKYNSYLNNDPDALPNGTFNGVVGPIDPGGYVELIFNVSNWLGSWGDGFPNPYKDLRQQTIVLTLEANGYFGAIPTLGCKKDVYSVTVSKDDSVGSSVCNSSELGVAYKIEVNEAP